MLEIAQNEVLFDWRGELEGILEQVTYNYAMGQDGGTYVIKAGIYGMP